AAYLETPEALLGTFLLDRSGIARWSAGADVITDDRPRMEFFRRYGATMSDRDIATLLDVPAGGLADLFDSAPGIPLLSAAEAQRRAHRMYLRSEVDASPSAARAAALASRGTRFGLYRLGCDGPQLDALREESSEGERWRRQVALCQALTAPDHPSAGA